MGKKTRKRDKVRDAARQRRKRRAQDGWRAEAAMMDDWPVASMVPLPADPEQLAAVAPMPPSTTLFGGGETRVLNQSPAWCYRNLPDAGRNAETLELLARWPFRVGASGKDVPEKWTSLTVMGWEMASQRGETFGPKHVEMAVDAMLELEGEKVVIWHGPGNVMLMHPEFSGDPADVIATFERRANEPAAARAARRWSRIVVKPGE